MPFDKAFRIARLARLTRLARLSRTTRFVRITKVSRLVRLTLFLKKFASTASGLLTTNGLHYVLITTAIIIFLGGYGIYILEPEMESFGDALWWSMVTTTTVGYGDISPQSLGGRLLASFLMLVGIGLLGMVTGSVATFFVTKRQDQPDDIHAETKNLLKSQIDKLETLSDSEIRLLCKMVSLLHKNQAAASLDSTSRRQSNQRT